MTRSGWLVAAGGLAMLAAGRAFGLLELYVLGAVALALVALALVRVRSRRPPISARRTITPRHVPVGGQAHVHLDLRNEGPRRGPVVTLHDPVPGWGGAHLAVAPLAAGEARSAGYRLPAERRGVLRMGPLEATASDSFGLARRRWVLAGEATVTVLPAIEPLTGSIAGGGLDDPLAGVTHPVPGGIGDDDFASLRSYVVGDDLRRVHWATSARTDDLVVRQDDPPWQGQMTLLLDARAGRLGRAAFERAVSAAASLLNLVAERGDRARLVVSDATDSGLTDARTSREVLLELLALVEQHEADVIVEPPADGRSRNGGLVVISGPPDGTDLALISAQRTRFASVTHVIFDDDRRSSGAGASDPTAVTGPGSGSTSGSTSTSLPGSVAVGRTSARTAVVVVSGATSFASAWAARHVGPAPAGSAGGSRSVPRATATTSTGVGPR